MRQTIRIFSLFHIPIEINFSWFIILGLVIFSLSRGYFPALAPYLPASTHLMLGIITALCLFICLLLHELSHALVAQNHKLPIHSITLFIFGGVAHMEKEPSHPKVEFEMAIAGPLASFFLAAVFKYFEVLGKLWNWPETILLVLGYLFFINLAIAIFNLLPGFPLDGGRVLRSILWHFTRNFSLATQIASSLGKGLAYFFILWGLITLVWGGSFLSGLWLIFIGLFLSEAAESSFKQVILKKSLAGITVEKIMSPNVITLPSHIKVGEAIDNYFFKFRHNVFPVIEDDQLKGVVTLHQVKETPKENWDKLTVKEIMSPIAPNLIADKNTNPLNALTKMAQNELGRLLVIENNKLIGILSQKDILRLFEFKQKLGR